jgi:hypothetical protein
MVISILFMVAPCTLLLGSNLMVSIVHITEGPLVILAQSENLF